MNQSLLGTSSKTLHIIIVILLWLKLSYCTAELETHQPFKWSLTRLDGKILRTSIVPGAPSFIVGLCDLTGIDHCGKILNLTGFYMCPSSNRGKPYCNYPGHYFCAYWGCETIYLKVGFGPPEDPGWILGRTWGIRHWEPGADRGNLITIKKEIAPNETPEPIGPNLAISTMNVKNNTTNYQGKYTQPTNLTSEINIYGYSTLWKIMQASYGILNKTKPELTKDCWLCYNIRPPFYEAVGMTAKAKRVNGTNPARCMWKKGKDQTQGLTLSQVTGKGRCIGKVPTHKMHLCGAKISKNERPAQWLIPAANTKWICSNIGITPCISLVAFNESSEYCIQVSIIPRITYHPSEYIYDQHITPEHHLVKREPITVLTIATLLTISGIGAGTGIASLVNNQKEMKALRVTVDEDLGKIELAIDGLVKSLRSLSEVVMQNRRGLDLLLLQQGGLCVALKEECCTYADHTGVTIDTMTELRKRLEQRKREREAQQSWYESWFNYSPWLTTLLSTIAGPLLLLILGLTFGPCIFNKLITIVKSRLEADRIRKIENLHPCDPLAAK
uniref:Envelope glycoprotein n=1 Tax=Strix occidentalis caurina TaxID=311401 RepID=A0A8D0EQB9_STROC